MIDRYLRASNAPEAVRLFREAGPGAAYLGGGTAVNSSEYQDLQPSTVVDLQKIGMAEVEVGATGLRLGAGCTLQGLLEDQRLPSALRKAFGQVVNRNLRNVATLGGIVALNDPRSDVLPALLAYEAEVETLDPTGLSRQALEPYLAGHLDGTLVTAVLLSPEAVDRRLATARFASSGNARATVGLAIAVPARPTDRPSFLVAAVGLSPRVLRLRGLERTLATDPIDLETLEAALAAEVTPADDLQGSPSFKLHLAAVLVQRALVELEEVGR